MTHWFDRYRTEDHLAVDARAAAAWLTGQSTFRHSRLSPPQAGLLDALGELGLATVDGGFPYNRAALAHPYRREPLTTASLRNGAQYLAARHSPRFGQEVARHLQPLVDATSDRLLLLCGSSGGQLLTASLPWVRRRDGLRVLAVALGPVGRLPGPGSGVEVYVVQGRSDVLSRWGHRGPVHRTVTAGHLDYAAAPEVRAEVLDVARRFLR